ncbi:hypothetical protein [Roseobacter sinensis]|uniref:Uncharacterized protein n=1 Tax=Roseobacter sinensis TaxID=2931391 RepID=A0ABT3BEF0_9RHOB|nr:hypothetical protein [Roseobacter sp. WL0113]MCV3271951.1 hypothetical protein [Roseobacter sp. WL0113]
MSKEGQRYAAELKRLEDRKKELEDALGRLARDEADAEEVMELATLVEQLEHHVETARAAADMEKTMTKTKDVRKAAALNRQAAEAELDRLAKQIKRPGEIFEKAYSRALDTDMGRALMRSHDDAAALEVGGITSMDIDEACKNLAR